MLTKIEACWTYQVADIFDKHDVKLWKIKIVQSLVKPGGNLTGIKVGGNSGKALDWLLKIAPEIKNISATKRRDMINKIDNSGKFRTKVGEKLLYIIDKCEDHEKSQII